MMKTVCFVVAFCLIAANALSDNGDGINGKEEGVANDRKIRESGQIGTKVYYTLQSTVLSITGSGKMNDYNYSFSPIYILCGRGYEITSVKIQEGITSIGSYIFSDCNKLSEANIPTSVTYIGTGAFRNTILTNVTISANVETIGDGAFCVQSGLNYIDVEKGNENFASVKGILFSSDLTRLIAYPPLIQGTSYTIPGSVTDIGDYAFFHSPLSSVVISNSVEYIGVYAFGFSSNLKTVTLGNSIVTFGNFAFGYCDKLENVSPLPASVTTVLPGAFSMDPLLASLSVDPDSKNFKSIDGVLYSYDGTTLVQYPSGKAGLYFVIPDNVTTVSSYCFGECVQLQYTTIPETVEVFGPRAIYNYNGRVSIFYQGTSNFTSDGLMMSSSSNNKVCVSPDFKHDKFCGKSIKNSDPDCTEFSSLFNQCQKPFYENGVFTQVDRKNATEWVEQTNLCARYECLPNSGGKITVLKTCNRGPGCHYKDGVCNITNGQCEYTTIPGFDALIVQEDEDHEVVCENDQWVLKEKNDDPCPPPPPPVVCSSEINKLSSSRYENEENAVLSKGQTFPFDIVTSLLILLGFIVIEMIMLM